MLTSYSPQPHQRRMARTKPHCSNSNIATQSIPVIMDAWEQSLSGLAQHDLEDISKQLLESGHRQWAERPRTYFILARMGRLDMMTAFLEEQLHDISIPYAEPTLTNISLNVATCSTNHLSISARAVLALLIESDADQAARSSQENASSVVIRTTRTKEQCSTSRTS